MQQDPVIAKKLAQIGYNDLLMAAQAAQQRQQVAKSRPIAIAPLLAQIGTSLIHIGQKLETTNTSSETTPIA